MHEDTVSLFKRLKREVPTHLSYHFEKDLVVSSAVALQTGNARLLAQACRLVARRSTH